jgi:hypothetical protein
MSDSRAAVALDRLPWLEDEPKTSAKPALSGRGLSGLIRWSVPALLLVAGISYWIGSRTAPREDYGAPYAEPAAESPAATTVFLPEPKAPVAEEPELMTPPAAREAPPAVRKGRAVTRRPMTARTTPAKPKASLTKPAASPAPAKLQYWPARKSAAAAGRMVRIGTFASPAQAKKGWRGVVTIYPGMKPIPAVVVPSRSLRNGRTYYRLQMGTTSQAHSEVLCQRMRIIGQSCVVVGLAKAPDKAKP